MSHFISKQNAHFTSFRQYQPGTASALAAQKTAMQMLENRTNSAAARSLQNWPEFIREPKNFPRMTHLEFQCTAARESLPFILGFPNDGNHCFLISLTQAFMKNPIVVKGLLHAVNLAKDNDKKHLECLSNFLLTCFDKQEKHCNFTATEVNQFMSQLRQALDDLSGTHSFTEKDSKHDPQEVITIFSETIVKYLNSEKEKNGWFPQKSIFTKLDIGAIDHLATEQPHGILVLDPSNVFSKEITNAIRLPLDWEKQITTVQIEGWEQLVLEKKVPNKETFLSDYLKRYFYIDSSASKTLKIRLNKGGLVDCRILEQRTYLDTAPPFLSIQPDRIRVNSEPFEIQKIEGPIPGVEEELHLPGSCFMDELPAVYRLTGAILHHGETPTSGHYSALRVEKTTDGHAYFHANDDLIVPLSRPDFISKAKEASIFFFEKYNAEEDGPSIQSPSSDQQGSDHWNICPIL